MRICCGVAKDLIQPKPASQRFVLECRQCSVDSFNNLPERRDGYDNNRHLDSAIGGCRASRTFDDPAEISNDAENVRYRSNPSNEGSVCRKLKTDCSHSV